MLANKPIMGWNSWNTFSKDINEKLIMEIADAMVEKGYKDAGYEYLIIDDCWALRERMDGKLTPNPELFPHGMKYVADYIHSKGLKFGMYSCAGVETCAGYPSSYGYEFEDAKQFAEWEVDYLKYDFCFFPPSANMKNAYLTMSMALRTCGRDIVFAACNWGTGDPSKWMRAIGAHTYRSTSDIFDNKKSFCDIFRSQVNNVGGNAPGCFNDMDMLTVGMYGEGQVGLGGCTYEEYLMQFAMWSFLGSPLIIGGDIRKIDGREKEILLNKNLISINQDDECRPPYILEDYQNGIYKMMKFLDNGRFAFAVFNASDDVDWKDVLIYFDDFGIHSNTNKKLRITDAFTGEEVGIFTDRIRVTAKVSTVGVYFCELIN